MSFILKNQLDKPYILKLCQQIKLIKQSKIDWSVEHVIRFASLIKIDNAIKDIIISWQIDGNKLFDIQYLNANLDCLITDRNYMPLYKLFHVVNAILEATDSKDKDIQELQKKPTNQFEQIPEELEIDIAEDTIFLIKQELQKLNNINIIQLGSAQLARILKNANMVEQSESVSKWSLDGFSLLCIVGNQSEGQSYKNYYSNQDLRLLNRLSHIFIHLYYFQHFQQIKRSKIPPSTQINLLDDFGLEFNDINFGQSSFHSSQYGVSEDGDSKEIQDFKQVQQPLRNSDYGVSERGSIGVSVRNSEYGVSQSGSVRDSMRQSQYGMSQRGSLAQSELGESERGSTRDSMAQSMYSQAIDESNTSYKKQANTVAVSAIEDDSILATLMQAALKLPFNLLNLEPLQRIKICSIPYPFNINKSSNLPRKETSTKELEGNDNVSQKSQSIYDLIQEDEEIREFKIFNLTGAKFGRNPENDFSYPDELSISGKHAQIVFKDESYYIRDLGSKTGTFVYISDKKPLVLSDEQLVQLSYEVEFKVMIIKSDINEGIIKFQFKKPDNEPPYRAILKNNNTVRIGKAENSHIKLNNQSISSYHSQIKYEGGKFIMYDCNTRTGTWLRLSSKGVRSADRKLSKLDIIRISSKKTFLIQDMNEGITFASCYQQKGKSQ